MEEVQKKIEELIAIPVIAELLGLNLKNNTPQHTKQEDSNTEHITTENEQEKSTGTGYTTHSTHHGNEDKEKCFTLEQVLKVLVTATATNNELANLPIHPNRNRKVHFPKTIKKGGPAQKCKGPPREAKEEKGKEKEKEEGKEEGKETEKGIEKHGDDSTSGEEKELERARSPGLSWSKIHKFKRKRTKSQYHLLYPVAVDIGGSLAKIAYLRPPNPPKLPEFVSVEGFYFLEKKLNLVSDPTLDLDLSGSSLQTGLCGMLKFLAFPSSRIAEFIDFAFTSNLLGGYGTGKVKALNSTGGGSRKFHTSIEDKLDIKLQHCDELESMIRGLNFLIQNSSTEIFTYERDPETGTYSQKIKDIISEGEECYPYLLVSCGSGVSILKVEGPEKFHRVSGSAIGGATFYGLCRLLTGCDTFQEVVELWKQGDNRNVDLLVGDIYGPAGYETMDLSAETVAASFGKAVNLTRLRPTHVTRGPSKGKIAKDKQKSENDAKDKNEKEVDINNSCKDKNKENAINEDQNNGDNEKKTESDTENTNDNDESTQKSCCSHHNTPCLHHLFRDADIAQSLLFMISSNVAQIAYLNARYYGVKRVFFSGGFVRDNPLLWRRISWAIEYWSSSHSIKMKAHFLNHDGYLGALGALLTNSKKSYKTI